MMTVDLGLAPIIDIEGAVDNSTIPILLGSVPAVTVDIEGAVLDLSAGTLYLHIPIVNMDGEGSLQPTLAVGVLSASGVATLTPPPPVTLPAPQWSDWDAAVTYARAAFLRLRWLTSQVPIDQESVAAALILQADTLQELALLQVAAGTLLSQGINLA